MHIRVHACMHSRKHLRSQTTHVSVMGKIFFNNSLKIQNKIFVESNLKILVKKVVFIQQLTFATFIISLLASVCIYISVRESEQSLKQSEFVVR